MGQNNFWIILCRQMMRHVFLQAHHFVVWLQHHARMFAESEQWSLWRTCCMCSPCGCLARASCHYVDWLPACSHIMVNCITWFSSSCELLNVHIHWPLECVCVVTLSELMLCVDECPNSLVSSVCLRWHWLHWCYTLWFASIHWPVECLWGDIDCINVVRCDLRAFTGQLILYIWNDNSLTWQTITLSPVLCMTWQTYVQLKII